MTTKKKATKKTGKALAKQERKNSDVGHWGAGQLVGGTAIGREVVPFGTALVAFEAAFEKVSDVRKALLGREGEGFDVVANHARRLADAASNLQVAGWNLRESAYREADK